MLTYYQFNSIYYGPLLNLQLVFKPNTESDEGMITLCRKGCNPLKYRFDLSECQVIENIFGDDMVSADKSDAIMTDMETFFNDDIATNYEGNKRGKRNGKLLTAYVAQAHVNHYKELPWAKSLATHMSTVSPSAPAALLWRHAGSEKELIFFTLISTRPHLHTHESIGQYKNH